MQTKKNLVSLFLIWLQKSKQLVLIHDDSPEATNWQQNLSNESPINVGRNVCTFDGNNLSRNGNNHRMQRNSIMSIIGQNDEA